MMTTSPPKITYTSQRQTLFRSVTIPQTWNAAKGTKYMEIIAQYDALEERHCPTINGRKEFAHIETALPRHCAIIAASRSSRNLSSSSRSNQEKLQHIRNARARVHTQRDITPFTELSVRGTNFVIAHSALAYLLVMKFANVFCAKRHTLRATLKRVDLIARFISSALACEYLVGNRYYRNLPIIIAHSTSNVCTANLSNVEVTTATLQTLYDDNIDRLEACVEQYTRGNVSLESLRADPEFVKMFDSFWRLGIQWMRASASNSGNADSADNKTAAKIITTRKLFEDQYRFSRLFQYDIAHIFDNSNFSYVSFVRSSKETQLRLCNEGLTVALLTFAAIEPRMVTAEIAPKLGQTYLTFNLSSAANHVQSSDPLLGELLTKYRQHIPRANALYAAKRHGFRREFGSMPKGKIYRSVQCSLDSFRNSSQQQ